MNFAAVSSGTWQRSSFSRAALYTYFAKLLQLTYREAAEMPQQSQQFPLAGQHPLTGRLSLDVKGCCLIEGQLPCQTG